MKTQTLHNIVDFVNMATLTQGQSLTLQYELTESLTLVISRNPMTGAEGRFYATLPVVDGVDDYSRAEDWQTIYDVADRMAALSE